MSLVEQRAAYMAKLQALIDARQKEIDEKVAAKRLELENDVIAPYKAQLEQTQASHEMGVLVDFINDIDKMLAYETGADVQAEPVTEPEVEIEQAVEDINEPEAEIAIENDDACDNELEAEIAEDTFSEDELVEDANEIIDETTKQDDTVVATANLDAIVADIADTKAKVQAVGEGRPGMPGIVLPRR